MNYRHAYHAGNFADVFKHSVLILLLRHLLKKDSAFRVIETHAGRGFYDLDGIEAGKTGEARGGIGRIPLDPAHPAGLADLCAIVHRFNPGGLPVRGYPGSPHIIRALLRPTDRLTLAEWHPTEVAALRQEFRGVRQVTILAQDGYGLLKAALPPPERRGLVLIDPPYEETDEALRIVAGLRAALNRWPTGLYAVWYPLKDATATAPLLAELGQLGRPVLTAELRIVANGESGRLSGCGMAVLNPPWQLDESLAILIAALQRCLDGSPESGVRWLTSAPIPESTNR